MGLDRECERAMKFTIPAVRVAVSVTLIKKCDMNETEIARRLGIAQPAVSKYLNGNYSDNIKRIAAFVESTGRHRKIIQAIIAKKEPSTIADLVDSAASERTLVDFALKHS